MKKGRGQNPNPPFQGDYGPRPNQIDFQDHFNTFRLNGPFFHVPTITSSFSNLPSHFQGPCPTRFQGDYRIWPNQIDPQDHFNTFCQNASYFRPAMTANSFSNPPTTMAQHRDILISGNPFHHFQNNFYPSNLPFDLRSVWRSPLDPNAGLPHPQFFEPRTSNTIQQPSTAIQPTNLYFHRKNIKMRFTPLLKREYCLFRARFHHGAVSTSTKSLHAAEQSFFEHIGSSFEPACDFTRTLRKWWEKRNQYLSDEELLMCPLYNLSSSDQRSKKLADKNSAKRQGARNSPQCSAQAQSEDQENAENITTTVAERHEKEEEGSKLGEWGISNKEAPVPVAILDKQKIFEDFTSNGNKKREG